MADDFSELINELSSTLLTIEKVLNVKNMEVEIKDLEIQASVPNLWDDPVAAQVVTTRLSYLQNELKKVLSLRQRLDDVQVLIQLATDEGDVGSLSDAKNEINSLIPAVREMEVKTLLSGEYDSREALVTIRSEAGGVDAADWAEMLLRMYSESVTQDSSGVMAVAYGYGDAAPWIWDRPVFCVPRGACCTPAGPHLPPRHQTRPQSACVPRRACPPWNTSTPGIPGLSQSPW